MLGKINPVNGYTEILRDDAIVTSLRACDFNSCLRIHREKPPGRSTKIVTIYTPNTDASLLTKV